MKTQKSCKNCGKDVSYYKYFCDIDCEIEYTEKQNKKNNDK